ncbi:RNA binding motif protein 22 [Nowakowskiella sp. JEL0407]|nr:RNA binding motif protein 22 [Nowakowskiella sp. JEL0407]
MSRQGWEQSEFPILCETCLGPNPYIRMTKENYGKECKICNRPFSVFRWNPGAGMRFKKTEICQTCAKIKNVCQTCVLDLEYSLPVQVRDSILGTNDDVPKSDVNREYFVQNLESKLGSDSLISYGKSPSAAKEILKKMSRNGEEPYYKRNKAHICTFFLRGDCTRGDECPYRHEEKPENGLENQNIKDRYAGVNDPVALKMLNRKDMKMAPPEDKSIMSLCVTGIDPEITQQDLKDHFYIFGEIKSIIPITKTKCAFINFATRESAEIAMEKSYNNLKIKGHDLKVQWGKSKPIGMAKTDGGNAAMGGAVGQAPVTLDQMLNLPVPPPPPGLGKLYYPSADPNYLGTAGNKPL